MSTEKVPFQIRLLFGISGTIIAAILFIAASNLYQVNASLESNQNTAFKASADTIYATMEMQDKLQDVERRTALSIFQSEVSWAGDLTVSPDKSSTLEVTNQITNQKETITLPQLTLGGKPLLNNFELVDAVQKKVGGAVTFFQVLPGKLLRIATTVKKDDGARAVATYIPDTSPVYQAIMKGNTYMGEAFVVNAWYQTAYSPIKDATGTIQAVLFVGRPIITPEFITAIQSVSVVGKGYGFLFHEDGTMLVHPQIEGKNIKSEPFWAGFSKAVNNQIEFEFQGEKKTAYLKKYAPWKMTYGFCMNSSDLSHGLQKNLAFALAVLALLAVLGTMTVIIASGQKIQLISQTGITRLAKILFLVLGAVTIGAFVFAASTLEQVNTSLGSTGKASLKSHADTIYSIMEMQNGLLEDKIKADLTILQSEFARAGAVTVNPGTTSTLEVTNQITQKKETISLPQLSLGGKPLFNSFELVDAVQAKVGGTATIFQVLPGKLLRISTNVIKEDKTRAVGTYIPDISPVYQTALKGETFYGVAFVVNDWYQTAYSPLKDASGKVIAVLYVGRPLISPEFKAIIGAAAANDKGHGFLFHEDGTMLVHPKIPRENIKTASYWTDLTGTDDGLVTYEFQGMKQMAYLKKFMPWKMTYGFTMDTSDIFFSVQKKITLIIVVLALALVGFASTVLIILRRRADEPITF